MDLREHINKATGGALKDHRVIEGACFHDGIYYLCFDNISKGTCVVCKVKAGAQKEVIGASKPLKIGHANDCCVRDGIIYVTHSGSKSVIHRVSADTLEKLSDIKVKGCDGGFNGISCMGKGYIVKKMHTRKCYVLDANFKRKKTITLSKTRKDGQGMTWVDGKLYRGASQLQSTKNYISVYNSKGKCIKEYHYKHKMELEDVFVFGGTIKAIFYKKYKKKGKKHFEAHIKTIKK